MCGQLDRIESICNLVFDSKDGLVEKGWGPDLKLTEWRGKLIRGDWWLREGEEDDRKFSSGWEGSDFFGGQTDKGGSLGTRDDNPLILVTAKGKVVKKVNFNHRVAINTDGMTIFEVDQLESWKKMTMMPYQEEYV